MLLFVARVSAGARAAPRASKSARARQTSNRRSWTSDLLALSFSVLSSSRLVSPRLASSAFPTSRLLGSTRQRSLSTAPLRPPGSRPSSLVPPRPLVSPPPPPPPRQSNSSRRAFKSRRSFTPMMRFTLLSAAAISAVTASVSTSVFPNSLCQGASDSLGGLVGVGKVTLANGDVEVHCGCPSVRRVQGRAEKPRPGRCFFLVLTDTSRRLFRTTSPTLRRVRPPPRASRSATRSTTWPAASSRPHAASSSAPARAYFSQVDLLISQNFC